MTFNPATTGVIVNGAGGGLDYALNGGEEAVSSAR